MANIELTEDIYYILLSIEGTSIKDLQLSLDNQNLTIRELISQIVQLYNLPTQDRDGNPLQYLLGSIEDESEEPRILDFEDENGQGLTLIDHNIKSGTNMLLICIPVAGGTGCPIPSPTVPPPSCTPEDDTIISYNATGRNTEEQTIFDRSNPNSLKHLLPEDTPLVSKIIRRIQGVFTQRDIVNSTVFAPNIAERGEVMLVQVLLYKDSQYVEAKKRAKTVDPQAEEKNNQVIGIPLKKGDVVSAHLSFFCPKMNDNDIIIENNEKQIIWNSNVENIVFSVFIDNKYYQKLLNGKVVIKIKDIPVVEMVFCVKIVDVKNTITTLADISATKLDKVFISYSHADANKVQYISETCKAIRCDYFFDRHSLTPGDIYPEKIFEFIDNANLFILCWSENAASSKWVEKERKRALKNFKEHNKSFHFYPISIPPKAELPEDMKETFNFGELS